MDEAGRRPRPARSILRTQRVLVATMALACWLWAISTAEAETESEETPPPGFATLEVQVTNLDSDEGVVVVALLASADQYDSGDTSFRSNEKVPIHESKAVASFERIPYGTYAVKVFHDANSNGELDTNFVGFPKEGFGFSNDAMGQFGPPTFEQAAFAIEAETHRIGITTR